MMNFKVIKYINSKNILCSRFTKKYSSNAVEGVNVLQQLKKRALIKVEGEEVTPYLQGLMTNDMKHLQEKPTSMYALFLNTKGRVLYDSIIYSSTNTNSYLIECDSSVLNQFLKHLKIFRVKKKIDISPHPSKVWVLFNDSLMNKLNFNNTDLENIKLYQKAKLEIDKSDKYLFYKDPRMNLLGLRIISDASLNEDSLRPLLGHADVKISLDDNYRKFRYCLGVGEGVSDLPQGNCFPLEANADYLHGVSFHKGCYIGQELTARTHHTGVVRKRLMPLLFQDDTQQDEIEQESPIFGTENGKTSVGKVRGVANNVGLGLLRVAQVTLEPQLNVSGKKARTYKPLWWPEEAPKEKVSVG